MVVLSIIGYPFIYTIRKYLWIHAICSLIAAVMNIGLIIFWINNVAYKISGLLVTLLIWQLYNTCEYICAEAPAE